MVDKAWQHPRWQARGCLLKIFAITLTELGYNLQRCYPATYVLQQYLHLNVSTTPPNHVCIWGPCFQTHKPLGYISHSNHTQISPGKGPRNVRWVCLTLNFLWGLQHTIPLPQPSECQNYKWASLCLASYMKKIIASLLCCNKHSLDSAFNILLPSVINCF